eukprot:3298417-Rhodomonas_salina.1
MRGEAKHGDCREGADGRVDERHRCKRGRGGGVFKGGTTSSEEERDTGQPREGGEEETQKVGDGREDKGGGKLTERMIAMMTP